MPAASVIVISCSSQQSHSDENVIAYWAHKRSDAKWKDLAKMALGFLSIPAMSAEPERVFSSAKITIDDRRCQLSDEAVNALECPKIYSVAHERLHVQVTVSNFGQ
jgi:hypothetical protein